MKPLCTLLGLSLIGLAACGGSKSESPRVILDPDLRLLRMDLPAPEWTSAVLVGGGLGFARDLPVVRPAPGGAPGAVRALTAGSVALTLDPAAGDIEGRAEFSLQDEGADVALFGFDLAAAEVLGVESTSHTVGYTFADGLLSVAVEPALPAGETLELVVRWRDEDVEQMVELFPEGGSRVLANLISAESTFFTFGYPYWPRLRGQALFSGLVFQVTHPDDQVLAMSGEPQASVDNGDGTQTDTWSVDHPFQGQVGLALAPYEVVTGSCGQAALEIYAMPGMSGDGFEIVPETYLDVIGGFCDHFAARFGQPAISTVRFVGVDERFTNGYAAPGLVVVPNYIWDDDGTGSFLLRDFYLVHELAHVWWGNDVFVASGDDLWLIEGMADYVAASAIERVQGAAQGLWIWQWEVEPLLLWLWNGGEDHAILAGPDVELDPRVYYIKGAWVLRMLEDLMGVEALDDALAAFRAAHPFRVATTAGFLEAVATASAEDLDWFFEQWLTGTGILRWRQSVVREGEGLAVDVEQRAPWAVEPERYYRAPVTLEVQFEGRSARQAVQLEDKLSSFLVDLP